MTFYVGIVDQGGKGFGVWFPDLPGCTSGGATMDELFVNGAEAIRLWIDDAMADGDIVPAPRPVVELLADADVQATMRDDKASFMQIPLLLDQGRSARVNISIDVGLLETIDIAARQRGLTRSAFLASAAKEKIARGA